MRIAIVTIHETIRGGVEMYLASLMPMLRACGHQVQLVTEEGLEQSNPKASCLARVLEFQPDVILQNSLSDPADELRLMETGIPVAFFAHAYAGMCISGTRRYARPDIEICRMRFGPACWTLYFNRRCGGLNPLTAVALYRENQLRRRAMLLADAVIVASEAMADLVRQHGVPPERVTTAPFFVPDPPELEPNVIATRFAAKRALFVGRFTDLKGWRELLRAAEILRGKGSEWTLVFVGNGPDHHALQAEASRRELRIELHPWLQPEARDHVMGQATVLVLPSVWPEPFGLVGLEAARLGVPSVAFDVGGIRQWLIPGRTGLLATPGSAESLASGIAGSIEDVNKYSDMAKAARLQARRFGADQHVIALEAALARAAKKKDRAD